MSMEEYVGLLWKSTEKKEVSVIGHPGSSNSIAIVICSGEKVAELAAAAR